MIKEKPELKVVKRIDENVNLVCQSLQGTIENAINQYLVQSEEIRPSVGEIVGVIEVIKHNLLTGDWEQ